MNEYYRIPPLGQHYTQRWAKEDIENERQKGAGAGGAAAEGNGESKVRTCLNNFVSDQNNQLLELLLLLLFNCHPQNHLRI